MTAEDFSASAMLVSGSVEIRPAQPEMLPWLREQELSADLAFRWRHHGTHPSPAQFEETFWACLCSFVVLSNDQPVGIVSAYDYDQFNQHIKLASAKFSTRQSSLAVIRGMLLLIDYVFKAWPLRKIYFESAAYNAPQFARRTRELELEGRLTEHIFLDGEFHDLNIYALRREDWFNGARPRYFRGK